MIQAAVAASTGPKRVRHMPEASLVCNYMYFTPAGRSEEFF